MLALEMSLGNVCSSAFPDEGTEACTAEESTAFVGSPTQHLLCLCSWILAQCLVLTKISDPESTEILSLPLSIINCRIGRERFWIQHGLQKPKSPLLVTHFLLLQGHTSYSLPKESTNWKSNLPIDEPAGGRSRRMYMHTPTYVHMYIHMCVHMHMPVCTYAHSQFSRVLLLYILHATHLLSPHTF